MSGLIEPCSQTILPMAGNLASCNHQYQPGNSSQNASSAHQSPDAVEAAAECNQPSTSSDRIHEDVLDGKIASTHARVSESSGREVGLGVRGEEAPAGQGAASAAETSAVVDPTRQLVANDPVDQFIESTSQVQVDNRAPGLPSVAVDLEAQTPMRSSRTFNNISQTLDEIYTTQVGVIRLVGGVIIFAGVAFTLWQTLESEHK